MKKDRCCAFYRSSTDFVFYINEYEFVAFLAIIYVGGKYWEMNTQLAKQKSSKYYCFNKFWQFCPLIQSKLNAVYDYFNDQYTQSLSELAFLNPPFPHSNNSCRSEIQFSGLPGLLIKHSSKAWNSGGHYFLTMSMRGELLSSLGNLIQYALLLDTLALEKGASLSCGRKHVRSRLHYLILSNNFKIYQFLSKQSTRQEIISLKLQQNPQQANVEQQSIKFENIYDSSINMQQLIYIYTQISYLYIRQITMLQKDPKKAEQTDAIKKRRDNQLEQMRKTNRNQTFEKHRAQVSGGQNNNIEMKAQKKERNSKVDQGFKQAIKVFQQASFSMSEFDKLIAYIKQGDIIEKHYGMIGIGKLTLLYQQSLVQNVLDAGIIPQIISYSKQKQYPQLKMQASLIICIIAAKTTIKQIQMIIDQGWITLFMDLLRSKNAKKARYGILAIRNVSAENIFYRDKIIQAEGLINMIQATKNYPDQSLIEHCCSALSNFCRGHPLPKYDSIKQAITFLCKAIAKNQIKDKTIVTNSCWAIANYSDGQKGQIIIESGVIDTIMNHLKEDPVGLHVPFLKILGNITASLSDEQSNSLLDAGLLLHLEKFLSNVVKMTRISVCRIIRIIAAGNRKQVKSILAKQSLIKKLLQQFQSEVNDDVKQQICHVFSNMSNQGEPQDIFNLYQSTNIIRLYNNLLNVGDVRSKEVSLECLVKILQHGQKFKKNPLVTQLQGLGAVDTLQKLKNHKCALISGNCVKIQASFAAKVSQSHDKAK